MGELQKALTDPVTFLGGFDPVSLLKRLEQSLGPEAKRFAIAKLRPKLTKELLKQDLQWKEARLRRWNLRLRVDFTATLLRHHTC